MKIFITFIFMFILLFSTNTIASMRANVVSVPSGNPQSNSNTTNVNVTPNPNQPPANYPPPTNYPTIQGMPSEQAPMPYSTTPGSALSDSDITTNVQARIMGDASLMGTNIKVKTINGVVTLEGTASTQEQVETAGKIAKSVAGSKGVQLQITVQAIPPAAPVTPTAPPVTPTAPAAY